MPKVKKKSYYNRKCYRRNLMQEKRQGTGDKVMSILSASQKLEDRKQRRRESQIKRLLSPTKRDQHLARLKQNRTKRMLSPTRRAQHLSRLKQNQVKRLLSPTRREKHLQKLRQNQVNRLANPSKRKSFLEALRACQKKRLQCPINLAVHRIRKRESRRRQLLSPTKRADFLQRIRNNRHKWRLGKSRLLQLNRLRDENKKNTINSAANIVDMSRALATTKSIESNIVLKRRETMYNIFLNEKKEGPTLSCNSCNRLWFKTSIKVSSVDKFDAEALSAACGVIVGNEVRLCASCYNSLHTLHKIPTFSMSNKGLSFPKIPKEIRVLTELEERFICPRIPFMTIRAAVSDKQYLVKGRAVNVPINVCTSVNILPRATNETKVVPICFKRKRTYKSNVAFENVRPNLINSAAVLLLNSPVYRHFNITVDLQRINDVTTFQPTTITPIDNELIKDHENEDDEEVEPINVADEETMLTNAIVFAPGEGNKPESLFSEYVEAQSFIKIYGGELIKQPECMTYQNWLKSEIMRDDRRCAHVTKLFFSALKLRTSKIASSISFCLRKAKSKKNVTVKQILDEHVVHDLETHDSGFRVFAADRGAPAYWELKKKELFAMMRQLGPPTVFLTLSPAETRWPELIVVLKKVLDNIDINENTVSSISYQEKVRLVKNDPVTVARYFEYRMRRLFNLLKNDNSVFKEHSVIDYYIRTEFQQRGSPHIHCLLWLKNAPVYQEGVQNELVINFIDRFITCSSLISSNNLELQTHKHTFTCKKNTKKGGKKCRFDIPFFPAIKTMILTPLNEEEIVKEKQIAMRKTRNEIQARLTELIKTKQMTSIEDLIKDFSLTYADYITVIRSGLKRVTVVLKRSIQECMVNFYNPDILLLHEANMDVQFITDMYSCATYILNYLNKSNSGMSKLLREAASEIRNGNYTIKEELRLLANSFLNASEFSAQEAVYYILALPLSSCSRQCVFVNTNRPEKRVAVVKRKRDLEKLPSESTDIFTKTVLDHYAQRPKNLENICLADFVAWYNFSTKHQNNTTDIQDTDESLELYNQSNDKGKYLTLIDESGFLKKRTKAKIIRFINYNEHDEEYPRENVMLFCPWRDEEEMINTVSNTYTDRLHQIRENRSKYIYNEDIIQALIEAENIDLYSDDENDSTETPQNLAVFDAVDSQIVAEPDKDIEVVIPPNEHICVDEVVLPIPQMVNDDEYSHIVSTLNVKQREFLLHILHSFKKGKLPFYHCVLGGAGVGKSRLIYAIQQTILRHLNAGLINLETIKVLICAPTGKAAFSIKGTTLHTAFVLPLNQCAKDLVPLSSSTRNTLWSKLRDVKMIIIDEISMVGSRMIQQVDCRLKQVFKSDLPFAGITLIVFGDFNQLPPVGDRYIFESHLTGTYGEIMGNPLWELFTSYNLTEIMRQKDDLQFALALNNLAIGALDKNQIDFFEKRVMDPLLIPNDAIRLFRSNAEVDTYNNNIICKDCNRVMVEAIDKVTGQPSVKIKERLLNSAKSSLPKDSQGLPFFLTLSLHIQYMITVNLNVADGLVNGAVGKLKQIDKPKGVVSRLWLLFPDKNVGKERRRDIPHNTESEWTPIDRVVKTIKPCKSPYSVVRKQFPLVPAEAMTIYKSQGGTYNSVAVHLTKCLRRNELYVGLSRCTKFSGLYLVGKFIAPSSPNHNDKVVCEMQRLFQNPLTLACPFPSMFPNDYIIVYHNVQSLTKMSHWADFKNFMTLYKPNIFIAAETWSLSTDVLNIDGYNVVFRADCKKNRHPYGLVIWSKINTNLNVVHTYSSEEKESCIIVALSCDTFAVCTGYRPPSTPITVLEDHLENALNSTQNACERMIVLGDFNTDYNSNHCHLLYNKFETKGLWSQLEKGLSTTNAHTSIDCIFSNFNHYCGVIETLYSHHKALLSVPSSDKLESSAISPTEPQVTVPHQFQQPIPAPSLVQDQQARLSLQEAIFKGRQLFRSLRPGFPPNNIETQLLQRLVRFIRQGVSRTLRKPERNIRLPSHITPYFVPIKTTGDGNCFYYAISQHICGRESLSDGLRAVVAHHMELNEDFLENLPLRLAINTTPRSVLTNKNYAEILEVTLMSLILKRPINIYTDSIDSSLRIAPTTASHEVYLYLDLLSQHYTTLKLKPNKIPPLPETMENIPDIDSFFSYQ